MGFIYSVWRRQYILLYTLMYILLHILLKVLLYILLYILLLQLQYCNSLPRSLEMIPTVSKEKEDCLNRKFKKSKNIEQTFYPIYNQNVDPMLSSCCPHKSAVDRPWKDISKARWIVVGVTLSIFPLRNIFHILLVVWPRYDDKVWGVREHYNTYHTPVSPSSY